jgi:hypothetical protein
VRLPLDVPDEIEELTASTRQGFGSARVKVGSARRRGAPRWSPTTHRFYSLPVKKQVRTNEALGDGDSVTATIEVIDATASST